MTLPSARSRATAAALAFGAVLTLSACESSASSPADQGVPDQGVPDLAGADLASQPVPDGGGTLETDFVAPELLGRPTTTSISLNLVPSVQLEVYVEAGTQAGSYPIQTPAATHPADQPFVLRVDGLSADTAYVYRLRWRRPGAAQFQAGPERSFHTARPAGATFRFTVQSDSHLDENSVLDQYRVTLGNVLADRPDFHLDLGDTFMCEKHTQPFDAVVKAAPDEPTVVTRYRYERDQFGLLSHSVPLFLVNGNHEGELGWLVTGSGNDLPTWVTHARQAYYLNPTPDSFYSGDATQAPFVGQRASYYAFTWGDALFVALDPFWDTKQKTNSDGWAYTLGKAQYDWLAQTLAASTAKWKFVFLHNLVGGLDGQMRGGVEAAPFYEWGGKNGDGTDGFAQQRPGWDKPIHPLLVANKVTAVFHGHDHLYVDQQLDGIRYQEVPQPSAKNTRNGPMLAAAYHYTQGTIDASAGHLRVTVSPQSVRSEYVRAWLPQAATGGKQNGQISQSWTLLAQ
jgi:hypothetical protein